MKKPIFITARFRSGSTLLWNIFHQVPDAHAYYEPLHEQLPQWIRRNIQPQARHYFVEHYFNEYPDVGQLERWHAPEYGLTRLCLEAKDDFPSLKDYIDYLLWSVPPGKIPAFQFNRIDFRLPWIKRQYPDAALVHLYRSPREQWMSTISDYPEDMDRNMDADPYRITTWSRDLCRQFPFLAAPFLRHAYQRHYYLWKLSYLAGQRLADISISYEDLITQPRDTLRKLLGFAGLDTKENLLRCLKIVKHRPLDSWKGYNTDAWFSDLEDECEASLNDLGLNRHFGARPLSKIISGNSAYRALLVDERAAEWLNRNSQLSVVHLLNAADEKEDVIQSQRTELISNERLIEEKGRFIQKQNRIMQKQEVELASLEQGLAAKETVIQSFLGSPRYWLLNGPFRHIPLLRRLLTMSFNIRARFVSKLGVYHQYPPRPLNLPRWYSKQPRPADADLPVISIVTPSYNQAHFIERTMRSVLDQNYPNLQFVIQDGKSTDNTLEILKGYRKETTHFESRRDRGQAHAINLGFAHTSGEIMAYLNSDDMLLPGTLHFVARYFSKHPAVDVVYGHRIIVNEDDGEVGIWVLPPHDTRMLEWGDYVPQEAMFWRREIWEKSGGKMDESFKFALDWDLLIRFQQAGARIVRLPRFLGAFRVHGAQKSTAQIHDLGLREMNLLRQQIHGREVRSDEINSNLRAYLMRSVIYHKLYRLGILRY